MTGYIESTLGRGETIRAKVAVHWGVYFESLPVLVGAAMVWTFVLFEDLLFLVEGMTEAHLLTTVFAAGLTMMGVLGLIGSAIYRATTEMAVTDKKVIAKWGLIARRTMEQRLNKVESIVVHQGVLGRVFNYGTIYVHGTGSSSTPIRFVSDPVAFRREVEAAIEAMERAGYPARETA